MKIKRRYEKIITKIAALLLVAALASESVQWQEITAYATAGQESEAQQEGQMEEVETEASESQQEITKQEAETNTEVQEPKLLFEDSNTDWDSWEHGGSNWNEEGMWEIDFQRNGYSRGMIGRNYIEDNKKIMEKEWKWHSEIHHVMCSDLEAVKETCSFLFTAKADTEEGCYFGYQFQTSPEEKEGLQATITLTPEYQTYLVVKREDGCAYCYVKGEDGKFSFASAGGLQMESLVENRFFFGIANSVDSGTKLYFYDFKCYQGDYYKYLLEKEGENHKTPLVIESIPSKESRINKNSQVIVTTENVQEITSVILEYQKEKEWILIGEKEFNKEGQAIFIWDNSVVEDGNCAVRATAIDRNGNPVNGECIKAYTIDNTGIEKIDIRYKNSDLFYVSFVWYDVQEKDAAYFQVEQKTEEGFVSIGTVADATEMKVEGLEQDTEYTFRVVGYDDLGNRGEPSDEIIIKTQIDTTPPTIQSISPKEGRISKNSKITVKAYDDYGVASILLEYQKDDEWILIEEKQATDGEAVFTWDNSALEDGSCKIRATAVDTTGNRGKDEYTREYTIDNTGISKINITKVTPGSCYVKFEWNEAVEKDFSYYLVEQLKDGEFVRVEKVSLWCNYRAQGLETEKEYTFRVVGYDNLGNRGEPSDEVTIKTIVDNTPPVIKWMDTDENNHNKNRINRNSNITVYAYDDYEVDYIILEYKKDDEWVLIKKVYTTTGKAVFNWNNANLEDGTYTVRATAVDANGNMGEDEYTQEYVVDNTGIAKINITSATAELYYVDLQWEKASEEDFSYYLVEQFKNGRYVRADTIGSGCAEKVIGLTKGTKYTFRVVGYDNLGNRGEPSDEVTIETKTDDTPPVIQSMEPEGSRIKKNSEITVNAYDEYGVSSILLEYKKDNEWIVIEEKKAANGQAVFTWDNSALEDGTYTVRAIATDVNGNQGKEEYTREYVIDSTGISKINITSAASSLSYVDLQWEEALEEDFAYYQVEQFKNGEYVSVGTVSETCQMQVKGLTKDTEYIFRVVGYDTLGNRGEPSDAVTIKTKIDITAPVIKSMEPKDSRINKNSQLTVTAYDEEGVASILLEYQKGNDWILIEEKEAENGKAVFNWDNSTLPDGSYTIRATATDINGNKGTDEYTKTFTIDNTGIAKINRINATSGLFQVALQWEEVLEEDFAYVQVEQLKDGEYVSIGKVSDASKMQVKDLTAGTKYTFRVVGYDTLENRGEPSDEITVETKTDTTLPVIESIQSKGSKINKNSQITVNAYDDYGVKSILLEYQKDNEWIFIEEKEAKNGQAVFIWDNSILADGTYTIRATAVDVSGNCGKDEYTRKYTVDNTGISKINVTNIISGTSHVSLQWEDVSEEDFAYFQVEQLREGNFASVGTVSDVLGMHITNLNAETEYTFRVVGYDTLGNRGEASEEVTITTQKDTTPPVITQFLPSAKSFKDTINLSITATDNIGAVKAVFEYSFDESQWTEIKTIEKSAATANTFSHTWDISALPEGTVYVRVRAYDSAGNENAYEKGILTNSYQIDRTPPSAITDLKADGCDGYAALTWSAPSDTDVSYYKIYRAEGEGGTYGVLVSQCRNKNYYDSTTEYGKTYRYKITSVDMAGNESEGSNEVTAAVQEDTKAPVIYSVSPKDKSTVGNNTEIKALVYDNVKVSELTAEYKTEEDSSWTKVETVAVNAAEKLVSMKWNTENLTSNTYQLKVSAKDVNGNESDAFITTFQLDSDPPEKTELNANKADWKIDLSWAESKAEDFDHFQVYRKVYNEESYTLIKSTTETFYADKNVTPETDYNYYLRTVDKNGNYTDSEVITASAGSEDTIAPCANASTDMSGVTGVELAFDGTGSTDNVRIVEYTWDMGDGTVLTGAQPKHTYEKAGTYTVTLTVKDVKGNTDTIEITVTIYDPSTAGTIILQVTDQSNVPLSGAYVYVNDNSTGKGQTLKADSQGKITISGESGTYQFAAYKQDYLPAEKYINMEQGKTQNATIVLEAGDVVVGDLKVTKMELSELVEAGIDLTDPSNYNSYTYSLTLSFKESPLPVEYQVTVAGDGTTKTTVVNTGGGGGSTLEKAKDITFYPIKIEQETVEEAEEEIPLLAYLTDAGTISWMKEMFQVELGIINAAAPKFVLEDSHATLNLPEGVSLAELNAGNQQETIELGDIPGQGSASAIWYVRGDTSGIYELAADFEGTLMPFEKQVKATFKNDVTVQTGEGLKLIIHPEDAAYVGEAYYIQYELTNTSDRSFYNLKTTFGTYTLPGKYTSQKVIDEATGEVTVIENRENNYYIESANKCQTVPVMYQGDILEIGVFEPGETLYGTTVMAAPAATGEYDEGEYYFELVDSFVETLQGANLGVQVEVVPISSHASASILKRSSADTSAWGDPVDTTSGAFVEEYEALAVNGATTLSLDMNYSSLLTENTGELGKGWSHNFQAGLKEEGGMINLYWNPDSFSTFVREEAVTHSVVYGNLVDNSKIALAENLPNEQKYLCISTGLEDAVLQRKEDFTYELTLGDGEIYEFDKQGRLIKMTDRNQRAIVLTHGTDPATGRPMVTVTEGVAGAQQATTPEVPTGLSIYLHYNEAGQLIKVTDTQQRATTFTYENQCLTAITNPLGETIRYTYDEQGHILTKTNGDGVLKVTNQYDEAGRVVLQKDGKEKVTKFSYTEEKNGNLTVNITDRDGNSASIVSNRRGNTLRYTNGEGETTTSVYDGKGNLLSIKNAENNTCFYSYDQKGNQTRIMDAYGKNTSMTYDDRSNLTSVTDGKGSETKYTYDEKNLLTKIEYSSGKVVEYTYNENAQVTEENIIGLGKKLYEYTNGHLTKVTDMNGNATTYSYDAIGNLIETKDSCGAITRYTYDKLNRLVREDTMESENKIYASVTYTYDADGNQTSVTGKNGETTYYEYDSNGELSAIVKKTEENKVTDEEGNISTKKGIEKLTYEKDGEGHVLAQTAPDGTKKTYTYDKVGRVLTEKDETGSTVSYKYNKIGDVIQETDPQGNTTKYEYYPNGKLQKTIYPDESSTLYSYDDCWNLLRETYSDGTSTTYEYDSVGNLVLIRDALGHETKYQYDTYGRKVAETDPMGNKTTYTYDSEGNCLSTTNALGETVTYEYDSENRMISMSHPNEEGKQVKVTYEYDNYGRNIKVTDECGNTAEMTYDNSGNVATVVDGKGNTITTNKYDENNQLISVTDALNVTDTYTYDIMGNVTKVTDQAGTEAEQETTYTYNADSSLVSVKDAENGSSSYTYDKNKNITKATDPMGGETTYNYDTLNRITKEVNAIGSTYEYNYNAVGLLETYKNSKNQETSYTYDKAGRLTKVVDEAGEISYTYDKNGNVLEVKDKNGTITRTYDVLNRVTSYTDTKGNTIGYTYNAMGYLSELTYPDGTKVTYHYYNNGKLKSVTDGQNNTTTYEYDSNGLVIAQNNSNGTKDIYEHDKAGQLIKQQVVKGETTLSEITYTYDEAGNVVSKETSQEIGAVENIASATMTYDKANRLTTYSGEAVTYDAEGNMTYGPDAQGVMTEYKYNCRNQLVQAGNLTYEYDAEGNRIAQNNTETGIRTEYVVDTVSELSQVLVATEISKNSETKETTKDSEVATNTSVSGDGTKVITYVYGNGLLTQQSGEEYLVFHYNNIGSTILLTNAKGEAEETYSYGPYGELLSGDKNKTDYLYNGMYGVATDDNGLYYMRARYYNVSIKRFINQDVVNGSITSSQSLNKFSYVQGNPIKLTDPFGLSPNISLSGIGHAALNLLGIIPVLDFCDAINAAWYFAEGDYANAALCTVAAIPFLGSIAGTGIKWGMKAGTKAEKVAETVKLGSRISGGAGGFIISGAQALEATKNIHANSGKNGDKSNWSNTADYLTLGLSIVGMGLAGASIAKSGGALKSLWKGQSVVESVAVSNTTKRVASESGKGTYLKMNLQFFAESGKKTITVGDDNKSIVYRVIRNDENPLDGLIAKNPLRGMSIQGHVSTGSRNKGSQFISTTTDINVANYHAQKDGCRIVEIDLNKLPSDVNIYDLSTDAGRSKYLSGITAPRYARKSKEVLLEGYIPSEAIIV